MKMNCLGALGVAFALLFPAHSFAQSNVFVGGAATFPVGTIASRGEFAGAAAGWQATVGAQFAVGGSGLSIGPRVYYGANDHEDPSRGSNLFGATALLTFGIGDPTSVAPFLWAEIGVLSHGFGSDPNPDAGGRWSAPAAAGGAGISIPLREIRVFVAGGYNSHLGGDFDLTYLGLLAGLSINLGGE
jgi:hypothetical protein